jgi:DNA repair protein RadA/Sms
MFVCTECGAETNRWQGKCPVCGAWDSLKEISRIVGKKKKSAAPLEQVQPQSITSIQTKARKRIKSGINELDGTLGGGIIPGMVVLIGGEPGIGKSTLMLQLADKLARNKQKILYISGEESQQQIKLRCERLNCGTKELYLLCTTQIEACLNAISKFEPDMIVVDSIQSVFTENLDSPAGSISQLREITSLLVRLAKKTGIPTFLIGHVTKQGAVAGPKIIEHMVDTVLYFEGENQNQFKILRATKNRFGSTNEIGIFEMQSRGLVEIADPSRIFIHKSENRIGSSVGATIEGSRVFLVEVQGLISPANYGTSQRVTLGFDRRKLALLLAVIEKNLSLNLRNNDVFLNLAGGIKVVEPALDLAAVAAVISSFNDQPLPADMIFMGEVGLNGEIRPVSQIQMRIKEAVRLGYKKIIISDKVRLQRSNLIKIKHIGQLMAKLNS